MLFDLVTAIRSLGRAKGHAAAVVLILALGLGSATAIFSLVEASLFPGTNVADPATLVRIELNDPNGQSGRSPSRAHFAAYRDAAMSSFSAFSAYLGEEGNLVRDEQIKPVPACRVSVNFFRTLGVTTALGRGFLPEDETPASVQPMIISDQFWRSEFGADPTALGRTVLYGDKSCVIVGVLPRGLRMPLYSYALYVPFAAGDFAITPDNAASAVGIFARVKPGGTLAVAEAELRTFHPEASLPASRNWAQFVPTVVPNDAGPTRIDLAVRRKNWAMLGAVGLLYLIATVNAANLVLVRTLDRRHELGVRAALGGSRWRVVRPVLLEGILLAVASTLLGLAVAKWLFSLLLALTPGALVSWEVLYLNARSLQVLAGLGGCTGLLLAFVPLWQTSRFDIHSALKSDSHTGAGFAGSAVRNTFVIVQTALAVALLISTGLMMRTCRQLLALDVGFAPQGRVLVQISTPARDSTPPVAQAVRSRLLLDAITTLPGIASVSTSLGSIYTGGVATKYRVLGASDPTSESVVSTSYVGEHYFDTLGLPMLMGRGFAGLESGSPPAAVLSESLARQLFQDGNPIGRQLVFGSGRTSSTVEIIGVAGDVRRPRQEAIPRLYRPSVQGSPFASNSFFVRSRGEFGPQFEAEIRRAVFAVDPKLMVWSIQKVEDMVTGYSQTERSALIHLQALGTLALSLAAFGLFAMMNYNVVQRRSEFGVRYAIGATDSDIQGLVLFRAFKLVAGGLILGGCLAWALARSFGALLYQTPALDPLTNTVVALLLLATTLLACWLPLRRAAVIDVARLLRAE